MEIATGMRDTGRIECADAEALAAENASLRDRIQRALADAENTRRRAERTVQDTSKYAVADFAGELLAVADNLQCTVAAAERHSPERRMWCCSRVSALPSAR
jgi:molecular chaperone GrpE (heat shock protein)